MKSTDISFCMTICSRRRPALLMEALTAVAALIIPEGVVFSVLIVENDETPQYADIIKKFKDKLAIHYEVEPVPGLTHGRNRVLDAAEALKVDWIGSIDDDVSIPENWLIHMVSAIRAYPDTQVFYGDWRRKKNPNEPAWHPEPRRFNRDPTGVKIKLSSFNNIAVSAEVFSSTGMAIRFDHSFRFSGGEDVDFTNNYLSKGGIIRSVQEASATETIADSRALLSERIAITSTNEYTMVQIRHKYDSSLVAMLWSIQIVYRGAILGAVNIVIGFLALPFNELWGLRRYATGRFFLAKVHGIFRYYFGSTPEPYRDTPPE